MRTNQKNAWSRHKNQDPHRYDDMLDLPHYQDPHRPHMTRAERAAQFMPFAALTGHGDAIRETARLTEEKAELSESEMEALDLRLQVVSMQPEGTAEISIVYFQPDSMKKGGKYSEITGVLKKIDTYKRDLVFCDGVRIPIENIVDIRSDIFRGLLD